MDAETLNDITYFLKDEFKGLSKEYMLDKITNEEIQANWKPKVGDIIVGATGNIFVISNHTKLSDTIGGDRFFFNGGMCSRNGDSVMDSTHCSVLNKDGLEYYHHFDSDDMAHSIRTRHSYEYSKLSDYKYVPYPHEL
jgi:hypothetical protein